MGKKLASSAADAAPAGSAATAKTLLDKGVDFGRRGVAEAEARTRDAVDQGAKLGRRGAAQVRERSKDAVDQGFKLGQRGVAEAEARARNAANVLEGAAGRASAAGRDLRKRSASQGAAAAAQLGSSVRNTIAGQSEAVHGAVSNARSAITSSASASARQAVENTNPQRQARRLRNWVLGIVTLGAFAFGAGQATPRAVADLVVRLKEGKGKEG